MYGSTIRFVGIGEIYISYVVIREDDSSYTKSCLNLTWTKNKNIKPLPYMAYPTVMNGHFYLRMDANLGYCLKINFWKDTMYCYDAKIPKSNKMHEHFSLTLDLS